MGGHGRPRWIRIPVWVPVFPVLALAVCGLALWVLWHSPWSPGRLHSRLEVLRQENLGLESQRDRAQEGVGRAQAALRGIESEMPRLQELAAIPAFEDSSQAGSSKGFLDQLFGDRQEISSNAGKLVERSRRVRENWDMLLGSLEKQPALAARLPTIRPVRADASEVESFTKLRDPFTGLSMSTQGIAWGVPQGTPVVATGAGQVIDVVTLARWGKVVEIDHGSGIKTLYCHLSQFSVREGDMVLRGQVVGLSGMTGTVLGPRLFYAVFQGRTARSPWEFILPEVPSDSAGADALEGTL